MRLFSACAVAAVLALAAGSASAQQEVDVAFNVVGTSDYVFRGFSQTDEEFAIQGGIDITVDNGLYAGAWASNVDFGDGTDVEFDLYGGYRTEVSGFAVDVGAVTYFYPNAPAAADYDYVELKGALSRAIGPVTAGVVAYYSPNFFGVDEEATYAEVNAAITPVEKFTVSGAYGKQWLDVSTDYTTWNAGVAYALTDNLVLDVRYFDTDVDDVAIAQDRIVGTIKVLF